MPESSAAGFELSSLYETQYEILRANSPILLDRVYQLRYEVYCIENQFEDPAQNGGGRETDDDDDRAAHLLLRHRASGEAVGTARLIFPERQGRPLPIERLLDREGRCVFERFASQSTGEISRFAVSKASHRRLTECDATRANSGQARSSAPERTTRPFIAFGLFRGLLDICRESGITHLSAVMEPALTRLLGRFGLQFQPMGGLIEHHGVRQPCMALVQDLIDHVRDNCHPLWLYANTGRGSFHS